MNRFLTPLTNAILDRKGTIDKYMGDAIMAFWNAPLDDPQHEINACEAALDMLERIDALNTEREQEAKHGGHAYIPLNVGVGLNTGTCVVGNMGSDLRFDYSVLGDSVNLASRLEGQSKEYGFPIIVGSKTALAAKDKFAILELDFIMVKGKKEPEVIYAIAGREDVAQSGRFQRLRNLTIEMLALLSRPRLGGRAAKRSSAAAAPTTQGRWNCSTISTKRGSRQFQKNPPPDDWNGAYALLTKCAGCNLVNTTVVPRSSAGPTRNVIRIAGRVVRNDGECLIVVTAAVRVTSIAGVIPGNRNGILSSLFTPSRSWSGPGTSAAPARTS